MAIDEDARIRAADQWSNQACGQLEDADGSLEYFLRVEEDRYRQQYWQRNYFKFPDFQGKRVLEIGVGQGTDLAQFALAGAECHAIDITDNHLTLARQNFLVRGLTASINHSDATALPYPDNHFDCVYSFGVIHHIPEADAVLSEVYRVLKPGGRVMLALYYKWSAYYIFALLFRSGLLKGYLFRIGYDGLLAKIEGGADGTRFKPYVHLYSRRDMRKLLRAFDIIDISAHQLYADHFLPSGLVGLARIRVPLDSVAGWYLAAKAIKPGG